MGEGKRTKEKNGNIAWRRVARKERPKVGSKKKRYLRGGLFARFAQLNREK